MGNFIVFFMIGLAVVYLGITFYKSTQNKSGCCGGCSGCSGCASNNCCDNNKK